MSGSGTFRLLVCALGVTVAAIAGGSVASGAINHPAPGIFGTITAKGCPIALPGLKCPARPVMTTVTAEQNRQTVRSATTNSGGQYAMSLPAGHYRIVVGGSKVLDCPPKPVSIRDTQSVEVDITCNLKTR